MANGAVAKAPARAKGDGVFAKIWRFIRESYVETRYRSAWPTWQELKQFTIVVIFAVLIVGLWMAGLDLFLGTITNQLGR